MKLYKHLSYEERNLISFLFNNENKTVSEIARALGRNKTTISRELSRNTCSIGYSEFIANKKYLRRKDHKNYFGSEKYKDFNNLFLKYYDKRKCGVEATYNIIKTKFTNMLIPSLRQIFRWIKRNIWVIGRKDRLRQQYQHPPKRSVGLFSKFNNSRVMPIGTRPKYIDKREEYGHGEVDLIIGKKTTGYGNILTLVERKTREVYISLMRSKNAMKCNSVIYKLIKKYKLNVKTITCDNGLEFEKIGLLAHGIDAKVYFCEPYASGQRGSNEHINGIIRRWYKKGYDFNSLTQADIERLQNDINNMPRKMFNGLSSNQYKQSINIH